MEEETQKALFFNFTKILSPEKLIKHNLEQQERFRKRNNPSESDDVMMGQDAISSYSYAALRE